MRVTMVAALLTDACGCAGESGITREAVAGKGSAKGGEEQKHLVKEGEAGAPAASVKEEVDAAVKADVEERPAAVKAEEGAVKEEPGNGKPRVQVESLPGKTEPEEPVSTPAAEEATASQKAAEQGPAASSRKGSSPRKGKKRARDGGSAQKGGSAAKKSEASPAGTKRARGQSSLDGFLIKNPA